jgi:hypothetical protein
MDSCRRGAEGSDRPPKQSCRRGSRYRCPPRPGRYLRAPRPFEMLRQDRIFDRAEEGRVDAHCAQRPSSSGMLWRSSPAPPKTMMTISAVFTMRMILDLSWASASWPASAESRKKGSDEQAGGNRAERRLLLGIAVDAVDHQHHHRGAEQIVVERPQELGGENRQEAPRFQKVQRVLHRAGGLAGCAATASGSVTMAFPARN